MYNQYQDCKTMEIEYDEHQDSEKDMSQSLYARGRLNFIRKVYGTVGMQLLITAAFCVVAMFNEEFRIFQLNDYGVFTLAVILIIGIQIAVFCTELGRKHPINIGLITVFTLCESYIVSYSCSMVTQYYANGKDLILVALFLTCGLVVSLTLFAMLTKHDFTMQRGIIFVIAMSFLLFILVVRYSQNPFLTNVYCVFGVILFGIYLVVDTQMILGNNKYSLKTDDYILAAMLIYIDIIQIFIKILIFLANNSGRRN